MASITIASALAVVPHAVNAEMPVANKVAPPHYNQVYVKIILPADPASGKTNRPVVESWIAEKLKKQGQSKFTAATGWVPIVDKEYESTTVWDGNLDDKGWACPVGGQIAKRADGRIKVRLDGWAPIPGVGVTVSLTDEPGSREIGAVERAKSDEGLPSVAVLIGPPRDP
jgi:hypothetical protein